MPRRHPRGRSSKFATPPPHGECDRGPPDGVTVNFVPVRDHNDDDDAAALVTPDKHGWLGVHFAPGTEYRIDLENHLPKHIAFMVYIDDRPVTAAPLIMRAKSRRDLEGFTMHRERLPGGRGETVTEIEKFVARRPSAAGPRNKALGTVKIVFLGTRMINAPHGEHKLQTDNVHRAPQGSRPGVLVTTGGPVHQRWGQHAGGPRCIPCPNKRIGYPRYTIYEDKSAW